MDTNHTKSVSYSNDFDSFTSLGATATANITRNDSSSTLSQAIKEHAVYLGMQFPEDEPFLWCVLCIVLFLLHFFINIW